MMYKIQVTDIGIQNEKAKASGYHYKRNMVMKKAHIPHDSEFRHTL